MAIETIGKHEGTVVSTYGHFRILLHDFKVLAGPHPDWYGRRFAFTLSWSFNCRRPDHTEQALGGAFKRCWFGIWKDDNPTWKPAGGNESISKDLYEAVLHRLMESPYEKYIGK